MLGSPNKAGQLEGWRRASHLMPRKPDVMLRWRYDGQPGLADEDDEGAR